MKFYLQTLNPSDFLEINQAVSLSGVYTDPADFMAGEVNTAKTLGDLLEVMSESQSIIVYGIADGFRNMLEEGRHLQSLSRQLILTVPANVQGFMAVKASKRFGLSAACGCIGQSEQAAISMHNGAVLTILDLDFISHFTSAKKVLKLTLELAEEEPEYDPDQILAICRTVDQFRMALKAGARRISAPKEVYDEFLYSPNSAAKVHSTRDGWILTYTRTEVLDPDELKQVLGTQNESSETTE